MPDDVVEMVVMPDCADCKRPWKMEQQELDWWKIRGVEKGLTIPRRCKDCRRNRRRTDTPERVQVSPIWLRLEQVAEDIGCMVYLNKERDLADIIYGFAEELKQRAQRRREKNREQVQS